MGRASVIAAAFALVLTGGSTALAQPKQASVAPADAALAEQVFAPKADKKTLQWTEGRWGLKLDYGRPTGRQTEFEDVEAGAFFKLSPQLRVGGSLGLTQPDRDASRPIVEDRRQPRVRLETTLKF